MFRLEDFFFNCFMFSKNNLFYFNKFLQKKPWKGIIFVCCLKLKIKLKVFPIKIFFFNMVIKVTFGVTFSTTYIIIKTFSWNSCFCILWYKYLQPKCSKCKRAAQLLEFSPFLSIGFLSKHFKSLRRITLKTDPLHVWPFYKPRFVWFF